MSLALLAFAFCIGFAILAAVIKPYRVTLACVAGVFLIIAVGLFLFAGDRPLGGAAIGLLLLR